MSFNETPSKVHELEPFGLTVQEQRDIEDALEDILCRFECLNERMARAIGLLMYKEMVVGYGYNQGDQGIKLQWSLFGHQILDSLYGDGNIIPMDGGNYKRRF